MSVRPVLVRTLAVILLAGGPALASPRPPPGLRLPNTVFYAGTTRLERNGADPVTGPTLLKRQLWPEHGLMQSEILGWNPMLGRPGPVEAMTQVGRLQIDVDGQGVPVMPVRSWYLETSNRWSGEATYAIPGGEMFDQWTAVQVAPTGARVRLSVTIAENGAH